MTTPVSGSIINSIFSLGTPNNSDNVFSMVSSRVSNSSGLNSEAEGKPSIVIVPVVL